MTGAARVRCSASVLGRSSDYHEHHEWTQYAFDHREQAKVGVRSREWTVVGATDVAVRAKMAGRLRELGRGRVPR